MDTAGQFIFFGFGNIAKAVLPGVTALKEKQPVTVSILRKQPLPPPEPGIAVYSDPEALGKISNAVILLCVKPQVFRQEKAVFQNAAVSGNLIISMMAGISYAEIRATFGAGNRYIRCMPNTASTVGKGFTAYYTPEGILDEDITLVESVLSSTGKVWRVPEEDVINTVTAIAGSGPAYFFLLAEQMIDSAVALSSIAPADAAKAVSQTLIGAAALLEKSGSDLKTLRQNITSKGGTTEAAIQAFMEAGLPDTVTGAITAAYNRCIELAD